MTTIFKLTAIAAVAATLSACGGGGGGGGGSIADTSPALNLVAASGPTIPVAPIIGSGAIWDAVPATVTAGMVVKTATGVAATIGTPDISPFTRFAPLWAHSDVGVAQNQGWTGKGVQIGIIDDFTARDIPVGGVNKTHGELVQGFAKGVAPGATLFSFDENKAVTLTQANLDKLGASRIINMSVGVFNYTDSNGVFNNGATEVAQMKALLPSMSNGSALVVKSAGNEGVVMGTALSSTPTGTGVISGATYSGPDQISASLKGAPNVIFVGALSGNGGTIASYSNQAGADLGYQNRFLTVGVNTLTNGGLPGTSFAAPIVAGYGAIIQQKFVNLTGTQTADLLLSTAKWNANMGTKNATNQAIYGQGEASLSQALAPSAKLR